MLAYREAARRHLVSGEVGRGTYVLAGTNFTPGGSFRRLVVSETVSMRNSVFLVRSGF